MSQIFCVRREASLGLAVVDKSEAGKITLLALYPGINDDLSDFPDALQLLVKKHKVVSILVSPRSEGEPVPSKLHAFKSVRELAEIREMPYLVRLIDGRQARSEKLDAGDLDESSVYKESEKLSKRIKDLNERSDVPAYIQAYLCSLVFAKADESVELFSFGSLGSFEPYEDDYQGNQATRIDGRDYHQRG